MEDNFVVYEHYTQDTNELFYVGEGRPKRPYSKSNRNKFWNNKVKKHCGFIVKIVKYGLTKVEAETLEKELIKKYKSDGVNLTNLCDGPMFGNHWLDGKPKEFHPLYGTKNPEQSKRISEWNKLHSGQKSPTFGIIRTDLSERNKSGNFNRYKRAIRCIELNKEFSSIKEAKEYFGGNSNISRALDCGTRAYGYHWERMYLKENELSFVEILSKKQNQPKVKRPDLVERNKSGNFNRNTKKVMCVELNKEFSSIKEAKKYFGGNSNISRSIKENKRAFGYHWKFI